MERLRFYLSHSANPGYKGLFSPADILHIELEEVSPPANNTNRQLHRISTGK